MRIAQKFLLVVLAMSLLPLVGASIVNLVITQNALLGQIQERVENTGRHHLERLNEINSRVEIQLNNVKIKAQLRLLLEEYVTNPTPELQTGLNRSLQDILRQEPTFHRIHLLDRDGTVISSTDPAEIGQDYSQTEVFKKGSIGSNISVFFKTPDGELDHYLTAPLELSGETLGIAVVEATTAPYLTITKDYSELGATGESYLIRRTIFDEKLIVTPLRFSPNASLTPDTSTPTVDYRDQTVIAASNPIEGTDWTLITKIDSSEVDAPLTEIRTVLFLITGLTAVAASLSAWYLARRMTAPVKRLTDVVTRIARGDLSQRVKVESRDEIGVLATAFNGMTARLQELYSGLEQKVREKTQQLSEKVTALEQANAKDEAILSSIGDGVVITDNKGDVLLVNQVAARLLNIDSSKMVGQPITTCKLFDLNGAPIPPDAMVFNTVLKTNSKSVQEAVVQFADNSKLTLSLSGTPVIQNNTTIGTVQIIRDVTKEKEVDRMKTEFLSLASHQLRTPLSAIKWFGEMLLSGDAGKLTKDQKEFAQNITTSTERMIELVSSLLNISRIESGRIIIDPKPTDLKKMVEEIIVELQPKLTEKKQQFILSAHDGLPLINIDPKLTRQVYLNLLTNAIKYTPDKGEITVMISRSGDDIVSQVADNGYGIPKAQQNKVFQRFFRAENVTKVITDGTGLGLYLIKAIVDSQKGKIWFKSEEGKGTAFWFTVPAGGVEAKKGEVSIE